MKHIELAETIDALRAELAAAAKAADASDITFEFGEVELEFQVGVTKGADGKAGINFWVVEFGAGGSYAHETMQTVRITLTDARRNHVKLRVGDDAPTGPE